MTVIDCSLPPLPPRLRSSLARPRLGQDRAPRRRGDRRHAAVRPRPRARRGNPRPGESLDEAANWPDEMRSAPGAVLAEDRDAVALCDAQRHHLRPCAARRRRARSARPISRATLKDPNASLADKQLALRFVVHLVGDLHQPLHVGKCCDKGGNDVKVTWFGKPTNLHAVWDSALVDDEQLSFTELAAKLERHISERRRDRLVGHQPARLDQRERARSATRSIRPPPTKPAPKDKKGQPAVPDLSYAYVYRFTPVMEQRLSQAGVRLAAYLNASSPSRSRCRAERAAMIRRFVAALAAAGAGRLRDGPAAAVPRRAPVEVQILAFNDFHGNLETPPPVEVTRAGRQQARRSQPAARRISRRALTGLRAGPSRTRSPSRPATRSAHRR